MPAPDGTDWAAYFAAHRAAHEAAIIPESRTVVLRRSIPEPAAHASLGRAIRGVLKRVGEWPRASLGWSLTYTTSEYYAGDSITKPGQEAPEHRKGELKKPGYQERHWWLAAAHPGYGITLRAHWLEGVTSKGGRSFGFQEAMCTDPVGVPRELFADYAPDARSRVRVKGEPGGVYEKRIQEAEYAGRVRDRTYNDGASYLNHQPVFGTWKEFDVWLSEWEEIMQR